MSQPSSNGNPVTSVVEGAVGLTGLSDWGRIASRIASWSIIFLSVVYFAGGLLLAARYYKHARSRRKEKEHRVAKVEALNNLQASTVARAAGARVLIIWVTVLIPVVYTLIGAVLGFVLGMSIGSLLAGACILAKVELTSDLEIVIGIFIGFAKVVLAFVPSKVSIMFL
jgi:hypothetical protein